MIDRSIIEQRANAPQPLAREIQVSGAIDLPGASLDAPRMGPLDQSHLLNIMVVYGLARERVDIGNRYVNNFVKLWSEKFGSTSSSTPEDLLSQPDNADKYLVPNWTQPALAAWFEKGIPDDEVLSDLSLTFSKRTLEEDIFANIQEVRHSNNAEFCALVDMALGCRLVGAAQGWRREIISRGHIAAQDVIWTEARVLLSTETNSTPKQPPSEVVPAIEGLIDNLAKVDAKNAFDECAGSMDVVLGEIKKEEASPLVLNSYRVGIGPHDLDMFRRVQKDENGILAVHWIEANLGDPEIRPQRALLPPWADGFFVLLGAGMLIEFYKELGKGARDQARLLRQTNVIFPDI